MVAKHTPGPWVAFHERSINRFSVHAPGAFGGERMICVAYGAASKSSEAAANIDLIAAAPALLAALVGLYELRVPEELALTATEVYERYRFARRIIAKAEGGDA